MPLTQVQKTEIVGKFGRDGKDTGSTRVQIALLTQRISELTEQMHAAAAELQFEIAARIRDEIRDLKHELRGMQAAGV